MTAGGGGAGEAGRSDGHSAQATTATAAEPNSLLGLAMEFNDGAAHDDDAVRGERLRREPAQREEYPLQRVLDEVVDDSGTRAGPDDAAQDGLQLVDIGVVVAARVQYALRRKRRAAQASLRSEEKTWFERRRQPRIRRVRAMVIRKFGGQDPVAAVRVRGTGGGFVLASSGTRSAIRPKETKR